MLKNKHKTHKVPSFTASMLMPELSYQVVDFHRRQNNKPISSTAHQPLKRISYLFKQFTMIFVSFSKFFSLVFSLKTELATSSCNKNCSALLPASHKIKFRFFKIKHILIIRKWTNTTIRN